jgi:hypothetical protein
MHPFQDDPRWNSLECDLVEQLQDIPLITKLRRLNQTRGPPNPRNPAALSWIDPDVDHCLTSFRCGTFIFFRLANSSMFRLNKFATCRASSGV